MYFTSGSYFTPFCVEAEEQEDCKPHRVFTEICPVFRCIQRIYQASRSPRSDPTETRCTETPRRRQNVVVRLCGCACNGSFTVDRNGVICSLTAASVKLYDVRYKRDFLLLQKASLNACNVIPSVDACQLSQSTRTQAHTRTLREVQCV